MKYIPTWNAPREGVRSPGSGLVSNGGPGGGGGGGGIALAISPGGGNVEGDNGVGIAREIVSI